MARPRVDLGHLHHDELTDEYLTPERIYQIFEAKENHADCQREHSEGKGKTSQQTLFRFSRLEARHE